MEKTNYIPFISEVETFNEAMGKSDSNQKQPIVNNKAAQDFVYNFIMEELIEYKEACEKEDIVGIADALGDIMYVLCNGIMIHGLKDKFMDIYQEIQSSNMSKICDTEEIAKLTVKDRESKLGKQCHYEKVGDKWVVFRSEDRKVQKSINYFGPNLKKFL
jgi:predicted HAD superfamily Cof-like phosphohydrolase